MAFTREQKKKAFTHVVTNVLSLEKPVIDGITRFIGDNILDFINMNSTRLYAIKAVESDGSVTDLSGPTMQMLTIFVYYAHFHTKHPNGTKIGPDDWTKVTEDDLDEFRVGTDFDYYQGLSLDELYKSATRSATIASASPSTAATLLGATTTAPTSSTRAADPVMDFKKGIKRDPDAFCKLKDDKNWDAFLRSTKATARAQGVQQVLDPTYVPNPTDASAVALFDLQQAYMYSVAETTLLTDTGKKLVRNYESTYNAQSVYKDLIAHYEKSTKANLNASNLLTHVTSNRIDDGTWGGTAESYILNWVDKLRKYHALIDPTMHIQDPQVMTLLQNAVHGIRELREVKNRADLFKITNGTDMTYQQYYDLLIGAAQQYDSTFVRSKQKGSTRRVYEHYLEGYDGNDSYDDDVSYDIDTSNDVIEAMVTKTHLPGSRMPFSKWSKLSPKEQGIWDMLSDEAKAVILQASTTPNSTLSSSRGDSKSSSRGKTPTQRVNLHDVSAYDYLAMVHDLLPEESTMDNGKDDDDAAEFQDAVEQQTPSSDDDGRM